MNTTKEQNQSRNLRASINAAKRTARNEAAARVEAGMVNAAADAEIAGGKPTMQAENNNSIVASSKSNEIIIVASSKSNESNASESNASESNESNSVEFDSTNIVDSSDDEYLSMWHIN